MPQGSSLREVASNQKSLIIRKLARTQVCMRRAKEMMELKTETMTWYVLSKMECKI